MDTATGESPVPPGPATGAPFLTVIVPAYNEERRIQQSLEDIRQYLDRRPFASEVVVVDDGSSDGTLRLVEALLPDYPALQLVRAPHGGKGHAIKRGVQAGRGRWLFLCDADLSMPIDELDRFLPLLDDEHDIVIASREAAGARRHGEPKHRHVMGRVFNLLVRALAVRGIQDTQCGFKCFRAAVAAAIFDKQSIDGWGFDVELLFIAQKHGYRIAEVPINWHYRTHSKIRPVHDTLRMIREVWRVRTNARRGQYDRV